MNSNQQIDPKLQRSTFFGPQHSFQRSQSTLYEFYLSGEILEATEYSEWFDTIRNAGSNDEIRIYINSSGGDLYTALQFLRVFKETQAHVTCSIEGACMSAATMIFLHADSWEVTPHSLIMMHNYSGGMFGKGGELYDQLQFERAWSEEFMREVYSDFLTSEEITSILQNKDIWMTSTEVINRLEGLAKLRNQRAQEALAESA